MAELTVGNRSGTYSMPLVLNLFPGLLAAAGAPSESFPKNVLEMLTRTFDSHVQVHGCSERPKC